MAKRKGRNPFPYELKDIARIEKDFCIQIGYDLHEVDGIVFYPAHQVQQIYEIVLSHLRETLKSGSEEDKNDARWAIARLHIHPLRIH